MSARRCRAGSRLLAGDDEEVAIFVDPIDVAGRKPAVDNGIRGSRRLRSFTVADDNCAGYSATVLAGSASGPEIVGRRHRVNTVDEHIERFHEIA